MLFTSQIFLFFFLPTFVAVYAVVGRRFRVPFLTLASYVFYGWWDPRPTFRTSRS
jgi:alginate O-acetyltransferase complex protein AlgI